MKTSQALTLSAFVLALFAAHAANECRAQNPTTPVVVESNIVIGQDAPPPQSPQSLQSPQSQADARGAGKTARRTLGSIKGRVVGDGGEPLPGVAVFASARAFSANSYRYDTRAQHSATSDDEGNFSIGGLEPGLYGLSASMPGYVSEADPATGRAAEIYRPGDAATVRLVKGGVITGSVADAQGQPLIAVDVRAFRVRDLDGRTPDTPYSFTLDGMTDDRGVYRIYGLRPGIYVLMAGGNVPSPFGPVSAYGDVPTFYPSSTRDTAAEVTVRAGQDTAGIDIHYRDDQQGHRVTGHIEMPNAQGEAAAGISLIYASSGIQAGNAFVPPNSPDHSFSLDSVPDGDYDLQATLSSRDGLAGASAPQRISVRGADVTGLRLTITPLASASGTLVVEPASDALRASDACKGRGASLLPQETLVSAVADHPSKGNPLSRISGLRDAAPDAAGAFMLRNLEPGRYRLLLHPADEALYVRSVELPSTSTSTTSPSTSAPARGTSAQRPAATTSTQPQRANTAARDFFDIRAGQQLSGIRLRLAEGAASLGGHVVAAEGSTLPTPASLRVYLLPAEREHADDTLRFYETTPGPDGSFSFKNLAPGRYFAFARAAADPNDASPRPASWDAVARAGLRRDAETANVTVELQPCQRTTDFALRFPAQTK
ncbi:MAG TPA: carboxypeptidase-like regulatory domain-containing protein [Pyrinomonadaceae bacterium]|nr:carboxypeptidase-like regulatory domain-containing protein [Pyrinomonadaceae bacterium]